MTEGLRTLALAQKSDFQTLAFAETFVFVRHL